MARPRAQRVTDGVISKAEARALGLPRYFTGVPCIRGHLTERQVSNGGCMDCSRILGLETKRAGCRRRYHANKEAAAVKYRAYYLRRRGYMLKRTSEYRRLNPAKVNFHSARRTAMRRSAEGQYAAEDIARIRKDQRGCCAICGNDLGCLESIDHIIPLSKGGTNWPRNIQLVCSPCNSRKKNKDPIDFMRQIGRLL